MINFKLPKLSGLVLSGRDVDEQDYSAMIHVINGHAIVFSGPLCVCVNLYEYIKTSCSLDDTEQYNELAAILDFMSEKSYTPKFWEELTSKLEVSLNVDEFNIKANHYNKTIKYEPIEPNVSKHLELRLELSRNSKGITKAAITGKELVKLVDAFKTELKKDDLLVQATGSEHCLHFCFKRQSHIFGFIDLDFESSQEIFDHFDNHQEVAEMLGGAPAS